MTDGLYAITMGKGLSAQWSQIITKTVDTRSGDEIAADVIARAGLNARKGADE